MTDEKKRKLEQAADAWFVHVRLMDAVCRELGTRYAAVLQPALGVGVPRAELAAVYGESLRRGTPDEALSRLLATPGALETLEHLYGLMRDRARGHEWFHDLSGPAVIPYGEGCFHSPRYPNALGNGRIARAIADTIVAGLPHGRCDSPEPRPAAGDR